MIFTTDSSWKDSWHNWFAWHPVVVKIEGKKRTWAFLRNIKRKRNGGTWTSQGFIADYLYRLK